MPQLSSRIPASTASPRRRAGETLPSRSMPLPHGLLRWGLRGNHYHDLDFWQVLRPGSTCRRAADDGRGQFPALGAGGAAAALPALGICVARHAAGHAGSLASAARASLLAGSGGAGKSGTVVAGLINGLDSVGERLRADRPRPRRHRHIRCLPRSSRIRKASTGWD